MKEEALEKVIKDLSINQIDNEINKVVSKLSTERYFEKILDKHINSPKTEKKIVDICYTKIRRMLEDVIEYQMEGFVGYNDFHNKIEEAVEQIDVKDYFQKHNLLEDKQVISVMRKILVNILKNKDFHSQLEDLIWESMEDDITRLVSTNLKSFVDKQIEKFTN